MNNKSILQNIFIGVMFVCLTAGAAFAQTTEFTYQGSVLNGGTAASGNFDFEFALFDAPAGGSQVGSAITRNGVVLANGIFAVNLDFGASFPGANRYLEIRIRQTGGGGFTTLSPRQTLTSAPYSVKSLNSANADNATNAVNATNASNAVNATNAQNAVTFTGNLAGDVTGTQSATTVTRIQNRTVAPTAPLAGQVLKYNGTQWVPDTDVVGSGGGGGTITGVTPGTGLTGGGATGNVTVSIANAGVGTTQIADGSVTNAKIADVAGSKITGSITTATIPGANVAGAVANATNATNATNAVNATNATTALNFSNPLAGDVTGNQSTTTVQRIRNLPVPLPVQADDGKVLRYKNDGVNPAAFELATVSGGGGGTITGVTAGTGLTGGGTTGTVTVGIAPGGVGTNEIANNAVTDAKIAASAITAPKIATGQVVKSINALKDDVTLAAGTNITITPAGNTLTIAATGAASGVTGGGTVNRIPLFSGATAIGDSLITQSGGTIQMPAFVSLAATASGNNITFGSPNSGTGMTISGPTTRADVRLDGTTLRLNVGAAGVGPPGIGIGIDANGTVQLPNFVSLAATASGNNVTFGSPNSETGMTISGPTGRADVRFGGSTLKLFAGPAGGPPGNGMVINTLGNVGIGVPDPIGAKLQVFTPTGVGIIATSNGGSGVYGETAVSSLTAGGVYGKGTGSGSIGVIGEANVNNAVGVYGVSASPTGFGIFARNVAGGQAMYADGNVAQNAGSNGLVKAMIVVSTGGGITRCYNGITNSSTGTCGFNILSGFATPGIYRIDFGFLISNRFVSVSAEYATGANNSNNKGVNYRVFDSTNIEVFTFETNSTDTRNSPFTIIVF